MNKEQKLKEFNDIHRQVSGLYHEIAVKLKLSNSAFSILFKWCQNVLSGL